MALDLDAERELVICRCCGAGLRGRSFATIGPDDMCWHCHYHLHRCDNCRHFDGIGCLLDRPNRHTPVPGQHCPTFTYRPAQAQGAADRSRSPS